MRQRLVRRTPHFRPQVLQIAGIAAEFEGNEVILLVMGGCLVRISSRLKLLLLQVVRVRLWRPNGARPAPHADRLLDVGLGDLGICGAGGRLGVRVEIAWTNARRRLTGRDNDVRAVVSWRGGVVCPEDTYNEGST